MKPRIGMTLASTADLTTVVVIRWTAGDLDVTCGGAPMVDPAQHGAVSPANLDHGQSTGTQLGKRYCTEDASVELLCTKAGQGTLAVGGVPLVVKSAKPLPASD